MQRGDFICSIGGSADKPVFDQFSNDCFGVEYSIGYEGTFSRFRVFESHWHRAFIQGFYQNHTGNFFDEVIPVVFDPSEFSVVLEPEDYFVYVGRLTEAKGVHIACEIAEKAGVKLKVVGHGDKKFVTRGAEYLGALPRDERNEVLSKARACFCPTTYMEPFNCVAVEAQLCGTPVISTPWGGFTETIEQGATGFRCSMFREFLRAVKNVDGLNRDYVRRRAFGRYTPSVIGPQYEAYFSRVSEMHGAGWYAK
jgi:glycosyltransferase involved in cell wall biosynthesis